MTPQLQALTDKVTEMETVEASASALIVNLAAAFVAVKDDPAAIQALADRVTAADASLSAAVIANTPAAP
jgi:hypothetical protein